MEKTLVNKIAQSGLITFNLEEYFPNENIATFDLKNHLFQELILKEKDFRKALKEEDWPSYSGKHLCIFCSTDAIIPTWAYMLVSSYAVDFTESIYLGTKEEFIKDYYNTVLENIDYSVYADKRILIKGCSNRPVPVSAYAKLTTKLKPVALSIMYGEPCSTVPIFKRPRV